MTIVERIEGAIAIAETRKDGEVADALRIARLEGMIDGWRMTIRLIKEESNNKEE